MKPAYFVSCLVHKSRFLSFSLNLISKFISIVFTGFSWTNWTQSLDMNSKSIAVGLLFEELGIAKFMLESMCNRETAPYTPSTEGWNASKKLIIVFSSIFIKN